jgi:hypothetical protein
MVQDGEWTFEEFISLSEKVAKDMNGDDAINSAEDVWGASVSDDTIFFLFAGSGMKFAHIDDEGYIDYDFGDRDSILLMQEIFDEVIYSEHCLHPKVVKDFVQPPNTSVFTSDKALFTFELVKSINLLRNMESDFGVLPIPKYDEYQKDYASLVWVHHDCVLGIPSAAAEDAEMISVVLEYMSYLSYYDIYPIFYDTVIMDKSPRDEQSKEMLAIVFKTRLFDPGQYWDNGEGASGIQNAYLRLPETGNDDIVSIFKNFEPTLIKNFGDFNDLIDSWG